MDQLVQRTAAQLPPEPHQAPAQDPLAMLRAADEPDNPAFCGGAMLWDGRQPREAGLGDAGVVLEAIAPDSELMVAPSPTPGTLCSTATAPQ